MTATAQSGKIRRSTLNQFGFVPPKGFADWLKQTGRGEIIEDVDEGGKNDV